MSQIVFCHGIYQREESADILLSQWLPALTGGIRLVGNTALADKVESGAVTTAMAYYGDLFRTPDILMKASCPQDDDRNEWQIDNIEREIINRLARYPWLANLGMEIATRVLDPVLNEVTRYFSNPVLRTAIHGRLLNVITADTKVILSHSLGTVVAYEVSHILTDSLPLLVTLGSPLGLHTIVTEKVAPPPSFPTKVKMWLNVANKEDIIASDPDLMCLYGKNIVDYYYDQVSTTPHDPTTYLGRSVVAEYVVKALS